jgi:hypothetical protein
MRRTATGILVAGLAATLLATPVRAADEPGSKGAAGSGVPGSGTRDPGAMGSCSQSRGSESEETVGSAGRRRNDPGAAKEPGAADPGSRGSSGAGSRGSESTGGGAGIPGSSR